QRLAPEAALQRAELDQGAGLRRRVVGGFRLLQRALQRPDGVVDLALADVDVGDERADAVVAAARLQRRQFRQRIEAAAGVVQRLAAAQDVAGVVRLELEGGRVRFRRPRVLAGELQLTRQAQLRLHPVFGRSFGGRLFE